MQTQKATASAKNEKSGIQVKLEVRICPTVTCERRVICGVASGCGAVASIPMSRFLSAS
jgi:hypothetical protein